MRAKMPALGNARNHGFNPIAFLDRLPLDRLAYVHVAGGVERDGLYHDTHTYEVAPVLNLLEALTARTTVPGVMLERDDHFPGEAELNAELDAIAAAAGLSAACGLAVVAPSRKRQPRTSGGCANA